tara:strand:+ start:7744 stop:8607 length:864 start_codon:yes stop_codon:yes gene_type:complete
MFESIARELSGLKEEEYMTNKEEIIPQLTQLLKETLIAIPDETIGIAFSGGLDSSLLAILAQQTGKKFKPYTVGLPNAEDVDYAGRIALQMHWPVKIKILTPDEATTTIQEVTTILSNTHQDVSPTHVGIGAVVYSVLQMAKQDGIKTVIGGLSAEELFAGYKRHTDYGKEYSPTFIQQALWQGLKDMETRDLARNLPIAQAVGINLVAPFLNESLTHFAMQIHPSLKVTQDKKKIILRETAIHLGLPEEFAMRKKVACQYGSKFDKFMGTLAKQQNTTKKEYIKTL